MLRDGEITEAAFVWREGLAEWQPVNSVLPRLASIRQKEYLKFLGEPIPRGMTFEEAQQRLDTLVANNPAKKLALDRWDVLAKKRDELASYFERAEMKCPISDFEAVVALESIEAAHPNDFVGWNFVTGTNDPFDDNNHGTHTAGTIGAMSSPVSSRVVVFAPAR